MSFLPCIKYLLCSLYILVYIVRCLPLSSKHWRSAKTTLERMTVVGGWRGCVRVHRDDRVPDMQTRRPPGWSITTHPRTYTLNTSAPGKSVLEHACKLKLRMWRERSQGDEGGKETGRGEGRWDRRDETRRRFDVLLEHTTRSGADSSPRPWSKAAPIIS